MTHWTETLRRMYRMVTAVAAMLALLVAALLVGSLLAGCHDDDAAVEPPSGEGEARLLAPGEQPIAFCVGQPDAATRGHATDATTKGYTLTGHEVVTISALTQVPAGTFRASTPDVKQYRVQADDAAATPLTYAQGRLAYIYHSTEAAYNQGTREDHPLYWQSSREEATLEAWSFADGTTTLAHPDGQAFRLMADQRGDDVRELLYMPAATYRYTNYRFAADGTQQEAAVLKLWHQMARVVVRVQQDEDMTGNTTQNNSTAYVSRVKRVVMGDEGQYMPLQATWTKPTTGNYGTWAGLQGSTDQQQEGVRDVITCHVEHTPTAVAPTKADPAVFSAVVVPADYKAITKLFSIYVEKTRLNIGDGQADTEDKYTYYGPTVGYTFAPGRQYTFTVTLKDTEMLVSLAVDDWGTGTAPSIDMDVEP